MKKHYLIFTAIALLFVAGFQWIGAADETELVQETAVLAAPITQELNVVSGDGVIVPARQAALAFEGGGRVVELLVSQGDRVAAGDVLAQLDSVNLEIALQQATVAVAQAGANLQVGQAQLDAAMAQVQTAELAVLAAEAELQLAQAPPLPEEMVAAELRVVSGDAGIQLANSQRTAALQVTTDAEIRSAEAQVAQANANLLVAQDAYDFLIDNEILGPPEEDARLRLQIAQANLAAAQARLDEVNAGATFAQVQIANAGVVAAAAVRDGAVAQQALLLAETPIEQVRLAEVGVAQAETAVIRANLAVEQAKANLLVLETAYEQAQAIQQSNEDLLTQMVLTAPFAGTLADFSLELGQLVAPGVSVGTLADFSSWQIETTNLTELDVVKVAVGTAVSAQIDALPDETLRGEVIEISSIAGLSQGDIIYTVTIQLDEATADLPLRWGMTTFVDIET